MIPDILKMYDLEIKPEADKIFFKLAKKNPVQLRTISNKIKEIRLNPEHKYKFLRKPLQTFNRVHIDKHFVLIFKTNHKKRVIEVHNYGHHDYVYDWVPTEILFFF